MPTFADCEIAVQLTPEMDTAIIELAALRGVSRHDLCADLLRASLIAEGVLSPSASEQAVAEADLYAIVTEHAAGLDPHNFEHDVINEMFEHVRVHHPDTHGRAVAGGNRQRIHANLGKLVRRVLGAEVVFVNGKRSEGKRPKGAANLNKFWTRLAPATVAPKGPGSSGFHGWASTSAQPVL